jgi:hypothetical protein
MFRTYISPESSNAEGYCEMIVVVPGIEDRNVRLLGSGFEHDRLLRILKARSVVQQLCEIM